MVHGYTAYFSRYYNVYSYTISQDKWTKLEQCGYEFFSMAVVNNQLTTIGGQRDEGYIITNTLLCFKSSSSGTKWEQVLPPMPTARRNTAAVTTPTHLIVAGGSEDYFESPIVEALNTHTLQWSSVSSTPKGLEYPNMTLSNGQLYLSEGSTIFSCSVNELLKSCNPASANSSDSDSVWSKLAYIPVDYCSITTLSGQVLAIGGSNGDSRTSTGTIHQYNRRTNSWSVTGEMPTPRSHPLVAVLPTQELIVVGGMSCAVTEIASSTH